MYTTRLPLSLSLLFVLLFCVLLVRPHVGHAQYAQGGGEPTIVLSPAAPPPETLITASLDAYSQNTNGATISWYKDGALLSQFQNERSISFMTGGYGSTTKIAVVVKRGSMTLMELTRTITPLAIDMIIEADTFVPSFYDGRALPSTGALIRVIALPFTDTGSRPEELTYQWELGTTVLFGGPIRGKMAADILMPDYGDDYVTVTISDTRGRQIGTKSVNIALADPELHFYEDNPLRGLYPLAITDSLSLIGPETTVYGMPYYMAQKSEDKKPSYTWTIDGAKTTSANTDPKSITLRRERGNGTALVDLSILTGSQIPQYFSGAFRVNF